MRWSGNSGSPFSHFTTVGCEFHVFLERMCHSPQHSLLTAMCATAPTASWGRPARSEVGPWVWARVKGEWGWRERDSACFWLGSLCIGNWDAGSLLGFALRIRPWGEREWRKQDWEESEVEQRKTSISQSYRVFCSWDGLSELPWIGPSRVGLYIFHPSLWMWTAPEKTVHRRLGGGGSLRLRTGGFSWELSASIAPSTHTGSVSTFVLERQCRGSQQQLLQWGLVNWGPRDQCNLPHVWVNKILLEHSHGHSLLPRLWLLSFHNGRADCV